MREAVTGNGPVDKTETAPRTDFTTHVSGVMRELVVARDWLTVFQLPSYASELNPVESAWALLKRSLATWSSAPSPSSPPWSRPGSGGCSTAPTCSPPSSHGPA